VNTARSLVRGWVGLYTRGLPTDLRGARRAEIESDLWAHSEEANELGRPPLSVGIEMLTRLALGIHADILWRQSHRREDDASSRKEITMREPRSRQVWTVIGAVWASLGLAFAVAGLIDIQSHPGDRPADVWIASVAAIAIMAGLALALIGLLRIGRSPTTGRQMAILGAVVAGGTAMLLLSWMWVVGIVLALPLVVIAVVSARQVMEAGPQQPA
jgi:hypothetical protein